MLVCKNCNTHNEKGSQKCCKCNMKGMLVKDNTIPIINETPVNKACICKNCGSSNDIETLNCHTCRFPLPSIETLTNINQAISM